MSVLGPSSLLSLLLSNDNLASTVHSPVLFKLLHRHGGLIDGESFEVCEIHLRRKRYQVPVYGRRIWLGMRLR